MGDLLKNIWHAMILEDSAYEDWRERPNLFLRGLILIVVVALVAGVLSFAWRFVQGVQPVDANEIREAMEQSFEWQYQFNPGLQDPEAREMIEDVLDDIVPMIIDIANVQAPLPRAVGTFFQAIGSWLTGALAAVSGWLLYGALVLIVVNWLGGTAKLPEFLGSVALYSVPGLLGLLGPVPCLGAILGLIGFVWGIVVYVKATSVATGLDTGRSIVAVFAPAVILFLASILLSILVVFWFVIIF
jgi:hypothetical protein